MIQMPQVSTPKGHWRAYGRPAKVGGVIKLANYLRQVAQGSPGSFDRVNRFPTTSGWRFQSPAVPGPPCERHLKQISFQTAWAGRAGRRILAGQVSLLLQYPLMEAIHESRRSQRQVYLFRFFNLYPGPLAVQIGGTRHASPPGRSRPRLPKLADAMLTVKGRQPLSKKGG